MADAGLPPAPEGFVQVMPPVHAGMTRKDYLQRLQNVLNILNAPQRSQEEHDRRWRNMAAYVEGLPEDQKPTTLGGHRDALAKFGFNLSKPVPAEEAATVADFGVFMQRYGSRGMSLADSYEMEGQPDAQPRCDRCKVVGATKQCNRCGEWYCSWVCQKAARRQHRKVCNMVYDQRL